MPRKAGRQGGWQGAEPLDPHELKQLYVRQKLSLRQVARILGCSHQHVANELRRYGLPVRSQRAASCLPKADTPWRPAAGRSPLVERDEARQAKRQHHEEDRSS